MSSSTVTVTVKRLAMEQSCLRRIYLASKLDCNAPSGSRYSLPRPASFSRCVDPLVDRDAASLRFLEGAGHPRRAHAAAAALRLDHDQLAVPPAHRGRSRSPGRTRENIPSLARKRTVAPHSCRTRCSAANGEFVTISAVSSMVGGLAA